MALSHDELISYTETIDDLLGTADLDSISARHIRRHLESKLQTDLIPRKQAFDELAMQRFSIAQASRLDIKGPSPEQLETERLFRTYGNGPRLSTPPAEYVGEFVHVSSEISTKTFNRLPQEVLTLFVEHLVEETSTYWICKTEFPKLKALRLSCLRFAYNPRLMEILFRGIKLIAEPQHFAPLETADISKFAPYVQRLTFFPPFHSWALAFDGFKEIVLSQAIERYCYDHDIWTGGGSFADESDGHTKFMTKYWDGKLPFSDEELRDGYKRYADLAVAGRDLLESPRLVEAWTKALGILRDCRQFRIESQRYNGHAEDIPKKVDCNVYRHHHDSQHPEELCRKAASVTGEKLFGVAVSCLARAQVQPTALDLAYNSTGDFSWALVPSWDQLDLSKVEKLRFRPMAQCLARWSSWSRYTEEEVDERACAALDDLLRKCSSNITELHIKRECPLTWPRYTLVALPELRRIDLDGICVHNGNFAKLLPLMPKLEHYALMCTSGTGDWKAMLDAVRNHPKRIDLHWDQIGCNDCAEVSLYGNTAEGSDAEKDEDPWMDIARSLTNYLAGMERWNKCLRMWFENEHADASDSEDGGNQNNDVGQ